MLNNETGAGAYPLGVFVGGFRWSGSGAVSDWLAGRRGLLQHAASGASFGEIRAINYGLRYLAQTAAGTARWGERIGRRALCPDPAKMSGLLGPSLTLERGLAWPLYYAADALFTAAARFRVIPGFGAYKPLLDSQLGCDYREDSEYADSVRTLSRELRGYMRRRQGGAAERAAPWEDDLVVRAASNFLGIFHRRLSEGAAIPIFDNAFSGLNPELFGLVSPGLFSRRVFILVCRDPRDQFADLARLSGSTFPWSYPSFIRQYQRAQRKAAAFLESARGDTGAFVRLVRFEAFVMDTDGTRTRLRDDLEEFWRGAAPRGEWGTGPFAPEASARNIGQWRAAGRPTAMRRIERDLAGYLAPESAR